MTHMTQLFNDNLFFEYEIIIKMSSQSIISLITIWPENTILFNCNQYQSVGTIKIIIANSKDEGVQDSKIRDLSTNIQKIRFKMKSTSRTSYLVSPSEGEIRSSPFYITILIREAQSLEKCLEDKFKLSILVGSHPPIERIFKVLIEHKRQSSKIIDRDLQRVEIVSKNSGTAHQSTASIGTHVSLLKKSLIKKSKLSSNMFEKSVEQKKVSLKEDLDLTLKELEEKRGKIKTLSQDIRKQKARRRFMMYVTLIAIVLSFLAGRQIKQILAGLNLSSQYFNFSEQA